MFILGLGLCAEHQEEGSASQGVQDACGAWRFDNHAMPFRPRYDNLQFKHVDSCIAN